MNIEFIYILIILLESSERKYIDYLTIILKSLALMYKSKFHSLSWEMLERVLMDTVCLPMLGILRKQLFS